MTLPNYCSRLMQKVKSKTGREIILNETADRGFDCEVRYAEGNEPHRLNYRPEYSEHLDHFIVNSCFKIIRMWDSGMKLIAVSEDKILPQPEHRELVDKISILVGMHDPSYIEETSRFLRSSLIKQVVSFPADLRVEGEIFSSMPEHRPKQKRYLIKQLQDMAYTFDESILPLVPKKVYITSTAMNIVFVQETSKITGEGYMPIDHPAYRKGIELLDILRAEDKAGAEGDRNVTDAWSRELGLEGLYQWMVLEEII